MAQTNRLLEFYENKSDHFYAYDPNVQCDTDCDLMSLLSTVSIYKVERIFDILLTSFLQINNADGSINYPLTDLYFDELANYINEDSTSVANFVDTFDTAQSFETEVTYMNLDCPQVDLKTIEIIYEPQRYQIPSNVQVTLI